MTASTPAAGRMLLFGATGSIGGEVLRYFAEHAWTVTGVTRRRPATPALLTWDPLDPKSAGDATRVIESGPFDAVCWAHGQNYNDSVYTYERDAHEALYRANVLFIIESMQRLLQGGALKSGSRLCIVSSIWQDLARQEKLSYCVTKAALKGLVLSAANDLGRDGILVNAVLPGVLETPMTRRNLTPEQVERVAHSTQFGRLPTLGDVAAAVYGLCSPQNTGITGQFVRIDLGYSNVRIV